MIQYATTAHGIFIVADRERGYAQQYPAKSIPARQAAADPEIMARILAANWPCFLPDRDATPDSYTAALAALDKSNPATVR